MLLLLMLKKRNMELFFMLAHLRDVDVIAFEEHASQSMYAKYLKKNSIFHILHKIPMLKKKMLEGIGSIIE